MNEKDKKELEESIEKAGAAGKQFEQARKYYETVSDEHQQIRHEYYTFYSSKLSDYQEIESRFNDSTDRLDKASSALRDSTVRLNDAVKELTEIESRDPDRKDGVKETVEKILEAAVGFNSVLTIVAGTYSYFGIEHSNLENSARHNPAPIEKQMHHDPTTLKEYLGQLTKEGEEQARDGLEEAYRGPLVKDPAAEREKRDEAEKEANAVKAVQDAYKETLQRQELEQNIERLQKRFDDNHKETEQKTREDLQKDLDKKFDQLREKLEQKLTKERTRTHDEKEHEYP